jgi:hypothetical protein
MDVSGQLHVPAALPPRKEPPVIMGWETGWALKPVWTLWRRKNLASAGIQTPDSHLVASPNID